MFSVMLSQCSPSCSPSASSLLPRARSLLSRTLPQPLPTFFPAIDFMQVQARPAVQLKVDVRYMAPSMVLPAAYVRSSPFPFCFYGLHLTFCALLLRLVDIYRARAWKTVGSIALGRIETKLGGKEIQECGSHSDRIAVCSAPRGGRERSPIGAENGGIDIHRPFQEKL